MLLMHICDGCDTHAVLTPEKAFKLGWDYPPTMGPCTFMIPRLCPDCDITKSLFWALHQLADGVGPMLTPRQTEIMRRVAAEPESILVSSDDKGENSE